MMDRAQRDEEPRRRQACIYSSRSNVVPSVLGTDAARVAEETYTRDERTSRPRGAGSSFEGGGLYA
jgi:hypothetical protein